MSTSPPEDRGPTTDDPVGAAPPPGPRVSGADVKDLGRLRRSTSDRKVAGVAAGIARHLDIDPVVVRIAFVVLVFFGGGGLLLYGACWLFVPEDDTHQAVVNVDERARTGIIVVVVALAALATVGDGMGGFGFPWPLAIVAILVALWLGLRNNPPTRAARAGTPPDDVADADAADPTAAAAYVGYRPPPPPPDPRRRGPVWFWFTLALAAVAAGVVLSLQLAGLDVPHAAYGAVVVAACGAMLVVGAFYGRAGGLVPLGLLAAAVTLVLSVAAAVPGEMVSVGQTKVSPEQLSDLDREYAVGLGEIRIDLSRTKIDGDHELDLEVGMGHIQVLVPEKGLAVAVDADIGIGEIKVFDDRYSDVADVPFVGSEDDPVLTVTADGRVGQIEIINPGDLP